MPTRVPRLRLVLSALATIALHATTCSAQVTCSGAPGCSLPITGTFATVYVAQLQLSSAATSLTAPTAADFDNPAGVNTASAVTLTVRSNATYAITAAASTATFTGGSGTKPASDLRYTTDGFVTLKPVTGTGSALATAAAASNGVTYTIGYNTRYAWTTDRPGSSSLAITYTLTAP